MKTLGKFYTGTYDESHDLGIAKVDEGVACNYVVEKCLRMRWNLPRVDV